MAQTVAVYPREGTTYPDAAGVPITSDGAIVDVSKYIRDAINAGFLLTYDPLGIYQPDDRAGTGGGGGNSSSFATASLLGAFIGTSGGVAFTDGALSRGDGGGGQWYWDSSDSTTISDNAVCCGASGAGRWKRVNSDTVNVRWFGARGDDSQTLQSITPYTASALVTQQTHDADCINRAMDYLRSLGGGTLYIPRGVYRTYAFLKIVDFPLRIVGDGAESTIIRNCDASPTNAGNFGIFIMQPENYEDIIVENLTLDGNILGRSNPTAEWFSYNIVWMGKPNGRMDNVQSINASIDCIATTYDNDDARVSLQVTNCRFSDAFRNTLSTVSGCNQQWTNCIFENAGVPYGGTNPRYCIDIEPDALDTTLQNLTFTSCTFRRANGVSVAGGVWSQASFIGCMFDASDGSGGLNPDGYPYVGIWNGGQWSFTGCTFKGHKYKSPFSSEVLMTGPFATTQYVDVKDCVFLGCAPNIYTRQATFNNVQIRNSQRCLVLSHGSGTFDQQIEMKNVTLVNVTDHDNLTGGGSSAFYVNGLEGYATFNNVEVLWCPELLPAEPDRATFQNPYAAAGGFYIDNSSGATLKFVNCHAGGFYQKYRVTYGLAPGAGYKDWLIPSGVQADTAGQTTTPGSIYYKGCTEYGDNP